jgi:cell wall-associated NlpC family hydrolase
MTAPTSAALALFRSNLPVRRVASASTKQSDFASVLKAAKQPTLTPAQLSRQTQLFQSTMVSASAPSAPAPAPLVAGGPEPMKRSDILKNAESLMGIPYVWGGTVNAGLDCSAFVSKVWGVSRHTTDNLASISHAVSKDELQAGDALNLTTANDPEGDGHVRLFDRWADAAHTKMYVYEETPPRSIHHVINWDPKYQPMRRTNVIDA